MKKNKFQFILLVCSFFVVVLLTGCPGFLSTPNDEIYNNVNPYHKVTTSEIPKIDYSNNYILLRNDSDITIDTYIEDNLEMYESFFISGIDDLDRILYNWQAGEGVILDPKSIDLGLSLHIKDDNINYFIDEQSENYRIDIDWIDFILNGSTNSSLSYLLNEEFFEMDKEIELNISSYFTSTSSWSQYMPYSIYLNVIVDKKDDEHIMSGDLQISFASRLFIYSGDENIEDTLGNISASLNIEKFEDLSESDLTYIGYLLSNLDENSNYESVWNSIENKIWNNTSETHMSLNLSVGDEQGVLQTKTYSDAELFELLILAFSN